MSFSQICWSSLVYRELLDVVCLLVCLSFFTSFMFVVVWYSSMLKIVNLNKFNAVNHHHGPLHRVCIWGREGRVVRSYSPNRRRLHTTTKEQEERIKKREEEQKKCLHSSELVLIFPKFLFYFSYYREEADSRTKNSGRNDVPHGPPVLSPPPHLVFLAPHIYFAAPVLVTFLASLFAHPSNLAQRWKSQNRSEKKERPEKKS